MARVIRYEDLALAIEPDGDDRYRVHALSSPYGLTVAPFALPFRRPELEALIQEIQAAVFESGNLRAAGARLFRALFHGDVREIYLLSRGRTESLPDRGLRLRLILPTGTADLALLQSLPWELLYCEDTDDFLARNVLTPIVRQLAIPRVSSSFPDTGEGRVRILIAVAAPRGPDQLDDAEERARILNAWCQQENVEVRVLLSTTLSRLYETLRSDHYQVVHFIGHGSFNSATGVGSLVLETPEHLPHLVSGDVLAETLRASRELRLVFLNSCHSAQLGYHPGQDPLLGTASALVRRGIPAVIAMQFPVSDSVALTFSEAVYRSLARGSSLDTAVADGRLALYQADPESWEWITPALFTALSGSEAFRPLCAAVEERAGHTDLAMARLAGLFENRSFDRARQLIEEAMEQGPELADLNYYLALATLADRRPRFLKVGEFRQVEGIASRVLQLDDCAAHHLCFLAYLRKDFYLENHLVPPAPGYEELLRLAAASPVRAAKLDELVKIVPGAKEAVAHLNASLRKDLQ